MTDSLTSTATSPDAVSYPPTPQTTPTRLKERVGYDRVAVHAVLDEAIVCHVGFVVDGQPVVLPQLHARVGDMLYLHGSTGARGMMAAADGGLPVCVTVTLIDGLVLARSAFHHSVNYRSVVIHGVARWVEGAAAKNAALSALVDGVIPGRSAHVRGPSRRELAATAVLELALQSASIKTRSGPPADDESDYDTPYWAGVLPVGLAVGVPEPAPDLRSDVPIPDHVLNWSSTRSRTRRQVSA